MLIFVLAAAERPRPVTDVVTISTGEKMVGEIKKVEKDVLTIETPYSDSDFKIKWDKVVGSICLRQFLVETFAGRRVSGSLTADVANQSPKADRRGQRSRSRTSTIMPFERIVLVALRVGRRFRLQHDAGEPRQAAHARRQPFVQGRKHRSWTRSWRTCSRARSRTRRTRSAGTSAMTSGICSATAGTPTPRRTS